MTEYEVWCPSCNGTENTCDECDGTGYVIVTDEPEPSNATAERLHRHGGEYHGG